MTGINLMQFAVPGDDTAMSIVTLGHVGLCEFRRALVAQYGWDKANRMQSHYEYAVFRDDESILLNSRPDDTGAKPVTVAYFETEGPSQL